MSRLDRAFEPLRITAHLTAPIVTTEWVHLDAILVATAVRRCGYIAPDSRYHQVGWEPDDSDCPRLPLAREYHGGRWWYRCSAWEPVGVRQLQRFGKKWDMEHEYMLDTTRAKTVTISNAKFKEAWIPVPTVFARTLVWHAVGNRRRVWDIARRISHVGKKGSQGYGIVSSVEVEATGEPLDGWDLDYRHGDGPARNIPADWAIEQGLTVRRTAMAPLVHPYWRRRAGNVVEVAR